MNSTVTGQGQRKAWRRMVEAFDEGGTRSWR